MTASSSDRDSDENFGDEDRLPRWVKVSGAIFILFVLVIVVLHLTGRGLGGH